MVKSVNDLSQIGGMRLLFSRKEVQAMLDIGEKKFKTLPLQFIKIGKTKKYTLEDLQAYIESNRQNQVTACQLKNAKAPRSIGTTSQCMVIGFAEAVKRTISRPQNR